MASTSYYVTISSLSQASPGDGFIDMKKVEQYRSEGSDVTTYAQAQAKERANQRFQLMVNKLQLLGNLYVSNVTATGANASTAALSFTFNLTSEHGDECLATPDEDTPGVTLTGNVAIKRAIARSLSTTVTNDYQEVYDPTSTAGKGTYPTANAVRFGSRIEALTVGAAANNLTAAEAAISVTKL